MLPTPELSRPLQVARIPAKGSHEHVSATPIECAALATRLGVPAIHSVFARLLVAPWRGGGVKVTGTARLDLDQVSVVSLEQFRTHQDFEIERYFLSRANVDDDVDVIENGEIDIGEIVAETLALDLDPYPRRPGEQFEGLNTENTGVHDNVAPFGTLKQK